MTLMFLDGMLVILLLFGIKAVREFYDKYKEFISLKNDLNCILRHVQLSMKSAQGTIDTLQTNIKFAAENITPFIPEANTAKDDLKFLIENAEVVCDRLENLTREMKKNYLTPQTVVFDPKDTEHKISTTLRAERTEPHTPDIKPEHRGFFSTISRAR